MKRRTVLFGCSATLALATGGVIAWPRIQFSLQLRTIRRQLELWFTESFGEEIAGQFPARSFLDEYFDAIVAGTRRQDANLMALAFVESSNLIQSVESGESLAFFGLYDPYERPCANPLSAFNAPDGEQSDA